MVYWNYYLDDTTFDRIGNPRLAELMWEYIDSGAINRINPYGGPVMIVDFSLFKQTWAYFDPETNRWKAGDGVGFTPEDAVGNARPATLTIGSHAENLHRIGLFDWIADEYPEYIKPSARRSCRCPKPRRR